MYNDKERFCPTCQRWINSIEAETHKCNTPICARCSKSAIEVGEMKYGICRHCADDLMQEWIATDNAPSNSEPINSGKC